jgi:HD superfamily phosphohydrolase
MRHLHQLGSNHFVFPSANHSRLEHSLGTGHLCLEFLEKLKINDPEIEISPEISKGIVVAGLCHNMGHGPFSYPFTDFVHDKLGIKEWGESDATLMLLDDLIDKNSIDISNEQTNFIKDVIVGSKKYSSSIPNWSLEILNNKLNGLDVDKLDFIRRDSYKLGIFNQSIDGEILFRNAKIINDSICYRYKDALTIYELFLCRYRLFREFYLHRVAKGIDLMIKDVFTEVNEVYDFKSSLYDPAKYIKLNDSILNEIFYSKKDKLQRAKNIIKRIYTRDLYKFVGEKSCHPSSNNYHKFINLREDDILNCSDSREEKLYPGDIKIMKYKLDFCKGEEDPVNYVKFYRKRKNEIEIFNLDKNEISLLVPNNFLEYIIRVYVTSSDKLNAAKKAFIKFCEINGDVPHQYEKKSACKFEKMM